MFSIRPVDPEADAALLHGWVTHPKARFWQMQDADVERVAREYRAIADSPGHEAYLGLHDGRPAFLLERYDPAQDPVGDTYPVEDGDVGMHFLVAPTDEPVHGFTREVIASVMELLFADRGDAAGRGRAGRPQRRRARAQRGGRLRARGHRRAPGQAGAAELLHARAVRGGGPVSAVEHLAPARWAEATRGLVAKALAEFAHERLLEPREEADGRYAIASDDGSTTYRFAAERHALDHWVVEPAGIARLRGDEELPLDALDFVLDLRETLGLDGERLGLYLEEISSTLSASAYKLALPPLSAAELAQADFQTIEARMTEGHPCFVANSGRLGFDASDYLRYAPEAAEPVRLVWVAAHRDCSTFSASAELDYERHFAGELGLPTLERFACKMEALGLDLADYHLIPAHPWQWSTRLAVTFAADVARRRLVCLGAGDDEYLPQQSIRTFFNISEPQRHYVKTALSVVNMGFVRGLSAAYMEGTPAINDWVAELVASDPVLAASRIEVLRECAAVGYRSEHYEAAAEPGSPYPKMLAALWRESPVPRLRARRAARDDGLAAARRPRRALARGGADRALAADGGGVAARATSTPTCGRCCTASTPTTSSSCRTGRT